MLNKHSWRSALADTALLTYMAKKRSEIAPGVGEGTDMFTAGPGLGTCEIIGTDVAERLERIYRRMKKRDDRIQRDAQKEVNDYVRQRDAQRTATQQRATTQQK